MRKYVSIAILAFLLTSCVTGRKAVPVPQAGAVYQRVERATTAGQETYRATQELRKAAPVALRAQAERAEKLAASTVKEVEQIKVALAAYEKQAIQQAEELQKALDRVVTETTARHTAEASRDRAVGKLWFWRVSAGLAATLMAVGAYFSLRPRFF